MSRLFSASISPGETQAVPRRPRPGPGQRAAEEEEEPGGARLEDGAPCCGEDAMTPQANTRKDTNPQGRVQKNK